MPNVILNGNPKKIMLNGVQYLGGSSFNLMNKSITENGTYNAENDNADGYSSVNVNVPQLFSKVELYQSEYDALTPAEKADPSKFYVIKPPVKTYYANFTGQGYIELPFTLNDDHQIYIDFQQTLDEQWMYIIGNSAGISQQSYFSFRTNSTGYSTSNRDWSADHTSRHVFLYNYISSTRGPRILFDGEDVAAANDTISSNYNYYLAGSGRSGLKHFTGKINEFKIISNSTGNLICHLKAMKYNGDLVFRDIINEVNYTCNGMTVEEEV